MSAMDLTVVALVVLGAFAAFAAAIGAMALGARLTGRCLRGSCGGTEVRGADGEPLSCASCPNRAR
jgi:hypothetical protein